MGINNLRKSMEPSTVNKMDSDNVNSLSPMGWFMYLEESL